MEVKLLQFIRDAPKKLLKMIYDERFVDNLLKIPGVFPGERPIMEKI